MGSNGSNCGCMDKLGNAWQHDASRKLVLSDITYRSGKIAETLFRAGSASDRTPISKKERQERGID